jgi:hypothetical protein
MIVAHPTLGYAIATPKPWVAFHPFQLAKARGVTRSDLFNRTTSFEVLRNDYGTLVVRPIEPPRHIKREPPVLLVDPTRFAKGIVQFDFPAKGASELEEMATRFPDRAAARAYELASIKNDASAWWVLAFGHRSEVIRRIVEARHQHTDSTFAPRAHGERHG